MKTDNHIKVAALISFTLAGTACTAVDDESIERIVSAIVATIQPPLI